MKQVAAPAHILFTQQLAGTGLPGVLITIVAQQTAEKKYRDRHIRINSKEKLVYVVCHVNASYLKIMMH
jgi:hypothetical protein